MRPQSTLAAALACAGLAVAAVATDVAWTFTSSLEGYNEGEWRVIASSDPHAWEKHRYMGACLGTEARLVLDNDRPISARVPVEAKANTRDQQVVLFDETVQLSGFDVRIIDLQVPPAVEVDNKTFEAVLWAQVGDHFLSGRACTVNFIGIPHPEVDR